VARGAPQGIGRSGDGEGDSFIRSKIWHGIGRGRNALGTVIGVNEVLTEQAEILLSDIKRAGVSFVAVPRGIVFNGGEPVGVLVWLVHGKPVTSVSAIEGANSSLLSSLLYVSNEAFIKMHVDSLLFGGNIVKLYRYAPRVYPVYYKSKTLRYDNTSLEDALRFKVEEFPMYKWENGEFRRIKEGKYLTDIWKDSFLLGGVTDFITVYPDGTVHKEELSLESLEDRFLSGNMARCLYGDSVIAFHLFEYRKFVVSEEYRLLAGRNRITRADCGIKEVVTEGTNIGAVVLKDFVANNGVCRTMDDIDFVDISRLSNDIKVLDLSACEHLRGVRINLFKIDGFSLLYPKRENYRDGEFKLTRCNLVNIQGEIRATDVVVYDSEFSSDDLFIQMFPQGLQNVVTNTGCLFNGVERVKRLDVHSTEQPVYDYDYEVSIDLIKTSIEEISIDFSQGSCRLKFYINKCSSLRKVSIYCKGKVSLSDVWNLLSNNSNKLEVRVVCGRIVISSGELSKIKHNNSMQKMFAGASVSIEASAVVWESYGSDSPRNSDTEVGFSKLPESLRGIIVRRGR
jgi:hypothetical protein